MKADSLKMSKVFSGGGDVHYVLPHFQREYAWEKTHWQTLLTDVLSLYDEYLPRGEDDPFPEHFMGALVVIGDGVTKGTIPVFRLVDGQQRLTTISVMLCALARLIKASQPGLYNKIRKLITNPDETGLVRYKLLPTTKYGDRQVYLAALDEEEPLPQVESRIGPAYEFFTKELDHRIRDGKIDPEKLYIVIANCLQVVFITLNQQERPYEIFESLNAKGKPLSQADLVRNYIAMKTPESKQQDMFERYWSKIETILQEKRTVGRSRLGELTAFLRHYLAFRYGVLCNEGHVYARFRDRMEQEFPELPKFVAEIAALLTFAQDYNKLLRPENETDKDVREVLTRLNTFEISTAYPFLLAVLDAKRQGRLDRTDLLEGLRILENYVVRRYLAGEPTNYLNKVFPALSRDIDPSRFAEWLRSALVARNYPNDAKVRHGVLTEELYDKSTLTQRKTALILESVERNLWEGTGGHATLDGAPTLEHVLPQTLSSHWKDELGPNWEQVYRDYLHTLGNLTIVTGDWNTTLSNAPFATKKQKLSHHALRLNADYFSIAIPTWNAEAIRARAEFLANRILKIWPALGVQPVRDVAPSIRPKALVVLGETVSVQTWRDVAFEAAQAVAEVCDDFDAVAAQLSGYFQREAFQSASRQLPNGWWVYLNLSRASVKSLCERLMTAAGLTDEDWHIEEESAAA